MAKLLFAIVVLGVSLPVAALADAPAKPKKPAMICRSIDMTSTRIPKRICHSVTDWQAIDSGGKKDADDTRTPTATLYTASKTQTDQLPADAPK